jgi:tRNA-Thr(GGU) m(6)t(6)A37 methyltransferase TsaA
MTENDFHFSAIAKVHSPYKEKFAIPRQPGLVSAAKGAIELLPEYNDANMLRGLEQYSHLWVIFVFHQTLAQGWKPLVRPPRLGGNAKMGVLATRSTFRPNAIGMSVVKLDGIEQHNKRCLVHISGLDLLDQTPVLDIKPYVPYADALADANSHFAQQAQSHAVKVNFTPQAKSQLQRYNHQYPELGLLIEQVLAQDPRPAYKKQDECRQEYGMSLYQFNIRWHTQAKDDYWLSDVISITEQTKG